MIAVIGKGFVGGAVAQYFEEAGETVMVYDIDPSKRTASLEEIVEYANVIFVAVPTPMDDDGRCNTRIVDLVMRQLDVIAGSPDMQLVKDVVLKSTVPPGTTDALRQKYKNLVIQFNPEFLTEANAYVDFKNQTHIIIGGKSDVTVVRDLYEEYFPNAQVVELTQAKDAEMVKYVTNAFLATKVAFSNEMWQICQAIGADHTTITRALELDHRLGSTHWKVPGPDGHFGFGGTCFPKDINAITRLADSVNVDALLLKSVWQKNLSLRPEQDWNDSVGRAVTE